MKKIYLNSVFSGLGTQVINTADLEVQYSLQPGDILKKTGINRLYRFPPEIDMAQEIAHCITCNYSGEIIHAIFVGTNQSHTFYIPTPDARICNFLGWNMRSQTVSAGCVSSVQVLQSAYEACFTSTKPIRVLVICADHTSQILDPKDYTTNILFSDGFAVADVSNYRIAHRSKFCIQRVETSSFAGEPDLYSMQMKRGQYFEMKGKEVYKFGVQSLGHIEDLLGITLGRGDLVIPHQPNLRMLSKMQEETPAATIYMKPIQEIGNISPGAGLHALQMAIEDGTIDDPKFERIVMAGFGLNLAYGGVVLEKI